MPIDETDRDEVMAVIRDVFGTGGPRGRDEAIREVARALGYGRVGSHIREVLDNDIRTAVRRGILDNGPQCLSLLARGIEGYTRDHLIEMLLAGMGSAWWDRDELTASTARRLGFRRTGSKIRQAIKSAINGAIRRGLLEGDGKRTRRIG